MLYYLFHAVLIVGVALGVYAVIDAIRNFEGK